MPLPTGERRLARNKTEKRKISSVFLFDFFHKEKKLIIKKVVKRARIRKKGLFR